VEELVEECKLHVVVHPWSIVEFLSNSLEWRVEPPELKNHPALNLGADAVLVFEYPDEMVISRTLMGWSPVVKPVTEVASDRRVPIDDMIIPSLFIVAHWSWIWD